MGNIILAIGFDGRKYLLDKFLKSLEQKFEEVKIDQADATGKSLKEAAQKHGAEAIVFCADKQKTADDLVKLIGKIGKIGEIDIKLSVVFGNYATGLLGKDKPGHVMWARL